MAWDQGFQMVAGADEAGRGPLAGPVVGAAVILSREDLIPGVGDSKSLSPDLRETLFDEILTRALAVGVGVCHTDDIEKLNILGASIQAMRWAIEGLRRPADFVLVDGNFPIPGFTSQRAVVKGDQLSASIGAASIVAKVVRDRMMAWYDVNYPGYNFASNKGYGTKEHRSALTRLGPCPIHRRAFKGVREFFDSPAPPLMRLANIEAP